MNSVKNRYGLVHVDNNKFCQIQQSSGVTDITKPGYIWVPYIIQNSTTVISDGDMRQWVRIKEIRKRREKIEKIMSRLK